MSLDAATTLGNERAKQQAYKMYPIPKDLKWAAVARANSALSGILLTFFATAALPASTSGDFLLRIGIATLCGNLSLLGRGQFVYTLVSSEQTIQPGFRAFLLKSYGLVCVTSLGTVFAAFLLVSVAQQRPLFDSYSPADQFVVTVLAISTGMNIFHTEVLRTQGKFGLASVVNVGTGLLIGSLVLNLWGAGVFGAQYPTPNAASLTNAIASLQLLVALCGAIYIDKIVRKAARGRNTHGCAPQRSAIFFFAVNAIPSILLYQADILIVGAVLGPEALSQYALASRLAAGINFVNSIMYAVLPRRISTDLERGAAYVENQVRFSAGVATAVNALLYLVILGVLVSNQSTTTTTIISYTVLAFAHVFNAFLGARSLIILQHGKAHAQALIGWMSALACVGATYLSALLGSLLFVIAVICLAICAQAIAEWVYVRRVFGIRTHARLFSQ